MMTSNALQKLIRACVDDGRTLRHESKFVDGVRAEALTRLAREREQFVTDLERIAKREQAHDGSWSELAREALRGVWVAAAGCNDGDAIRSCRHSRARTEALYDATLQASWPDEIRRVLAEQRRKVCDEADELNKLLF